MKNENSLLSKITGVLITIALIVALSVILVAVIGAIGIVVGFVGKIFLTVLAILIVCCALFFAFLIISDKIHSLPRRKGKNKNKYNDNDVIEVEAEIIE